MNTFDDRAVSSVDDILTLYPEEIRGPKGTEHPVLDDIAGAHLAMHEGYQDAADYAAAQADPLRATGRYLDVFAEDRGFKRQEGESDEDLRTRVFAAFQGVSPDGIMAVVNAILAPYTSIKAQYYEPELDCWFVPSSSDSVWCSFIASSPNAAPPDYPDRLYEHNAAEHDWLYRPQSSPGEAVPDWGSDGPRFVLRVPQLNDSSSLLAFVTSSDSVLADEWFIGTGVGDFGFIGSTSFEADQVYATLVNTVNKIKAHGVRWTMSVDPALE